MPQGNETDTGKPVSADSSSVNSLVFEDVTGLVSKLDSEEGPNCCQFVGDGTFGIAWVACIEGELHFRSENGIQVRGRSAFLFTKKCLCSDAYILQPGDIADMPQMYAQ